jgi:hypothetical protein
VLMPAFLPVGLQGTKVGYGVSFRIGQDIYLNTVANYLVRGLCAINAVCAPHGLVNHSPSRAEAQSKVAKEMLVGCD